jgi:hypothetical protein
MLLTEEHIRNCTLVQYKTMYQHRYLCVTLVYLFQREGWNVNSRYEPTSQNFIVPTSNCCHLDHNTDNENTSGDQDAVLSGASFREEAGHESTKPSSELQDGSEPALLCRVVDVTVSLWKLSISTRSRTIQVELFVRFPKDGIAKIPLNIPWLYP